MVVAGTALSIYRNSLIVPSWLTYAATSSAVGLIWWLRHRLKARPIVWRVKGGQTVSIRKLGIKPILLVGGFLLTLWLPRFGELQPTMATLLSSVSMKVPFLSRNQVLILVGDFDGPDPQNYRVTQNIYEGLLELAKASADLDVRFLHEPITFDQGSAVARAKAAQQGASIILWGSYGKTANSVQLSVNFDTLDFPYASKREAVVDSCGDGSVHKSLTYPVQELDTFTLQMNMSCQLRALTLVATGIARYKAGQYAASVGHFNEAIEQLQQQGPLINVADIYFWRADAYNVTR